ncbi:arginine methyltransferase NDUFAF7, mitochondrial [Seminavis robusta]|uniref:type II protein arginine methyltransferase n=1 Tax=Seminavis robusta TaxID=568900 RepID=A0A9N8EYY5_9STRA|nr:arginine methyltransferase NDUFAF7, mitochondrial [Seminavis robusta]|eukprot:Sro2247_g320610.1 arginine methyltransferase NDUFAF7, mitochondrial (724) ;mRNA; f:3232-5403
MIRFCVMDLSTLRRSLTTSGVPKQNQPNISYPKKKSSKMMRRSVLLYTTRAAASWRRHSVMAALGSSPQLGIVQKQQCCEFGSKARPTKMKNQALKEQQQKRKGTTSHDNNNKKEEKAPYLVPPSESALSKPPSLIRTDFSVDSSHELILPSGYEIPTTDSTTSSTLNSNNSSVPYVDYKDLYDPQVHLPSAPQDWSDYEPSTPLWEELAAQIGVLGRPMTVAEFMQHALLHPLYGYYSNPHRHAAEDDDDDDFDVDDYDTTTTSSSDNPIFGPRGDFVTAPEICQVFGESIQVWMVTQWETMHKPPAVQWVEFGPGRGILMADMVRFIVTESQQTGKLQEYAQALQVIHLIERSHPLRAQQQATLQEQVGDSVDWKFHNSNSSDTTAEAADNDKSVDDKATTTKPTIHVYWHDSFTALTTMIKKQKQQGNPDNKTTTDNSNEQLDMANMPLMVVCQELFDALPVHAFEMTKDGWRERMVDVAIQDELLEEQEQEEGQHNNSVVVPKEPHTTSQQKRPRLRIVLAPEVTPALQTLLHVDDRQQYDMGQVVEVCPEGILLVQDIAALLEQQGGAALIVDYGEQGSTDSLRGFWKHQQTHFLSLPGQTDVTADVDFTALKHAVNEPRRRVFQDEDAATTTTSDNATIKAYGPIPQGQFLVSMGAKDRVIQCIELDSTSDEEAENLFYALERLVSPEQMGVRYKVLALAPERHSHDGSFTVPPAGF